MENNNFLEDLLRMGYILNDSNTYVYEEDEENGIATFTFPKSLEGINLIFNETALLLNVTKVIYNSNERTLNILKGNTVMMHSILSKGKFFEFIDSNESDDHVFLSIRDKNIAKDETIYPLVEASIKTDGEYDNSTYTEFFIYSNSVADKKSIGIIKGNEQAEETFKKILKNKKLYLSVGKYLRVIGHDRLYRIKDIGSKFNLIVDIIPTYNEEELIENISIDIPFDSSYIIGESDDIFVFDELFISNGETLGETKVLMSDLYKPGYNFVNTVTADFVSIVSQLQTITNSLDNTLCSNTDEAIKDSLYDSFIEFYMRSEKVINSLQSHLDAFEVTNNSIILENRGNIFILKNETITNIVDVLDSYANRIAEERQVPLFEE